MDDPWNIPFLRDHSTQTYKYLGGEQTDRIDELRQCASEVVKTVVEEDIGNPMCAVSSTMPLR